MTALCAAVVKILHVSCIIKFGCSKELYKLNLPLENGPEVEAPPLQKNRKKTVFSQQFYVLSLKITHRCHQRTHPSRNTEWEALVFIS